MRKIKFRGKDIATNKWVYGYLYRLKGVYTICENIRYGEETPIFIDTLGQYTGLHDKNGVEIYEGDIVNVFVCGDYIRGYIKYNNKRGRFDVGWISELEKYKNGEEFIGSCSCMYNEYDDLEVIGNIWED